MICVDVVAEKKTTAVQQHDNYYYAKRAGEETTYPSLPSSSSQLALLVESDEDLVVERIVVTIILPRRRMLRLDLLDGVLVVMSLDVDHIGHHLVPLLDNNVVVVDYYSLLVMLKHCFFEMKMRRRWRSSSVAVVVHTSFGVDHWQWLHVDWKRIS